MVALALQMVASDLCLSGPLSGHPGHLLALAARSQLILYPTFSAFPQEMITPETWAKTIKKPFPKKERERKEEKERNHYILYP